MSVSPSIPTNALPGYRDTPVSSSNWRTLFRDIYSLLNKVLSTIPIGGDVGQIIVKDGVEDYAYKWITPVLTNELVKLNSYGKASYINELIDNDTLQVKIISSWYKLCINNNYSTFFGLKDFDIPDSPQGYPGSITNKLIKVNGNATGLGCQEVTDLPTGIIIFWYGTPQELIAVKSKGWKECTISNGFIRASNTINLTRSGSSQVTLSINNLPSHTHITSNVPKIESRSNQVKGGGDNRYAGPSNPVGVVTGEVDPATTNSPITITPPYYSLYLLYKL